MRYVALMLILFSALLIVPETELQKASEVEPAFLSPRVAVAPVSNFAAPSQAMKPQPEIAMVRPNLQPRPAAVILAASDDLPWLDATATANGGEVVIDVLVADVAPETIDAAPSEPLLAATFSIEDVNVSEADAEAQIETQDIAAAETAPEAAPVDLHVITGNYVNMREGPSSAFGVVTVVVRDQAAEVLKREGNWAHLRMTDTGDEGWVFGRYLAPADGA